jgi:hypothetical protein
MHTYDAIEYHPRLDAIVVMSTTEHPPVARGVAGRTVQPTWLYDLSRRRWSTFPDNGKPAPSFFGGSSAYDGLRQTLIGYRGAIWELDTTAGEWRRAAGGHHQLHHTMVYAPRRGAAYVFGDYRPTNAVWSYHPGAAIGEPGRWQEHQPGGDPCPPYDIAPVAYDASQDLFVLVVGEKPRAAEPSRKASAAATYLHDPESNTYTRLPSAGLESVGMNFMMTWDSHNRVVFLVTGNHSGVVTVWAMRPARHDARSGAGPVPRTSRLFQGPRRWMSSALCRPLMACAQARCPSPPFRPLAASSRWDGKADAAQPAPRRPGSRTDALSGG